MCKQLLAKTLQAKLYARSLNYRVCKNVQKQKIHFNCGVPSDTAILQKKLWHLYQTSSLPSAQTIEINLHHHPLSNLQTIQTTDQDNALCKKGGQSMTPISNVLFAIGQKNWDKSTSPSATVLLIAICKQSRQQAPTKLFANTYKNTKKSRNYKSKNKRLRKTNPHHHPQKKLTKSITERSRGSLVATRCVPSLP